jgi:hypothetical protein
VQNDLTTEKHRPLETVLGILVLCVFSIILVAGAVVLTHSRPSDVEIFFWLDG